MNFNERIKALKKQRAEILDKSTALSKLAETESRLFTEEEGKTFADYLEQVKTIDKNIEALVEQERLLTINLDTTERQEVLKPTPGVEVRTFKPFPGQNLTRYIATLARAKGNLLQAVELAKRFDNESPELSAFLKIAAGIGSSSDMRFVERAAVAPGTATNATWAGPLVFYQNMVSEFVDFLRPQTILGKLTGYRPVPFAISIPRQTSGFSAGWVGEGLSKPVGKIDFDRITLPWAKIALISVITDELARLSNPSAEMLVRNDLAAAVAQFMDQQFIDPTVAAVANVKPGAITNGSHQVAASGNSVAHVTTDLSAAMLYLTDQNSPMTAPVWIMHTHAYQFLITQRSSVDTFVWKEEMLGGKLMGIPFIVSNNVPIAAGLSSITLVDANDILIADDGQMLFDASSEASLQMDSAPTDPPVAATVFVSLWQQNMLGIKIERYIYWMMRRAVANFVYQITGFPAAAP
jgi:HK97 family phage major capsid protein